jgi:uncharacterized protein YgbK (DUF1537 family)
MMAVIADDFTGAAELAGISLRYGLSVIVCLDNIIDAGADVMIACTDSRSMQKAAAIYCTADTIERIARYQPSLWYKKIDSVLRGYVIDEAKVQMKISEKSKAFILPANPSLKRTIVNGEYFIEGRKITETGFVHDPEFPVPNANVKAMLHDETVQVLKHNDWLPVEGMVIGEAETAEDVMAWAALLDESWMLAGAGDFYTALLEKRYRKRLLAPVILQSPHLYICGTAYAERKAAIKELHENSSLVVYLPGNITTEWLQQIKELINEHQKLVLAIDETAADALSLRTAMASVVKQIVESANVKEIFIEGGSTAAAILQEMNITTLAPVNELQRGVVRMKAGDLYITVKPGSYQLPNEIINLYSS